MRPSIRISHACILFFLITNVFEARAEETSDTSIDSFLGDAEDTREIVPLNYEQLKEFHTGNIVVDSALNLSLLRTGTAYVWGGSDWNKGIDCSHFTMKVLQEVAQPYNEYLTTRDMIDIVESNGLKRVPKNQMRPGDLLVYGFYDADHNWHGHVVVLVDENYVNSNGKRGLVVGSHGGLGVEFIVYGGFPESYRDEGKLQTVLRPSSRLLTTD
jgi:hypothetical protein